MQEGTLYQPDVLLQKVPTLHPRYQWMDIELEPDDRVVLTTINGHATVESVIELSGLPKESVARVILKLVGRGVVLFDDDLPFYSEEAVLSLLPAFDPNNTNRDANLDDSDRMLLTLINGRTTVGQMEAALPLSRERLVASVIRLSLAEVITFEEPEEPAPKDESEPATASAPVEEPDPPAKVKTGEVAETVPERREPGGGPGTDEPRRFRNRQEAFEEATRRLLEGESSRVAAEAEAARSGEPRRPERTRQRSKPAASRPAKSPPRKKKKKKSASASASSIDIGALARIGFLVAVLFGGFATVRWFSSMTRGSGSVEPPDFAHIIAVEETLLLNNRLTMVVTPQEWARWTPPERQEKVYEIVEDIEPKKVAGLSLQDTSGKRLAEWDGRFITILND